MISMDVEGRALPAPARHRARIVADIRDDRRGGAADLLAQAAFDAGIGAWECDLASGRLSWTDGVYTIFGLPIGYGVDRRETVAMYAEESRWQMERLREAAIAQGGRFTIDAQIIAADGAHRWMRLTGNTVMRAGRAVRLYGLKQDITAERAQWEAMRRMAENDALTGLASRAVFQARFLDRGSSSPGISPLGALLLVDIDGFKQLNDRWGHAAGDAYLAVTAERLSLAFADALLIARIGGDEFAVLLPPGDTPARLEERARRAIAALCLPVAWREVALTGGASMGLAMSDDPVRYDAEALFADADAALYMAKREGRNRVRVAIRR